MNVLDITRLQTPAVEQVTDKTSAKEFPVSTLGIVQEDLVYMAPTVREAVGSPVMVYDGRDGVSGL